ncbi:hypothetical protein, partial [Bradyrhizobium sp. 38]
FVRRRSDFHDPVNLGATNFVVIRRHPGRRRDWRGVILQESQIRAPAGASEAGLEWGMFFHGNLVTMVLLTWPLSALLISAASAAKCWNVRTAGGF